MRDPGGLAGVVDRTAAPVGIERQRHDRHGGVPEVAEERGGAAGGLAVVEVDGYGALDLVRLDGHDGDLAPTEHGDRGVDPDVAADEDHRVHGGVDDRPGAALVVEGAAHEQERRPGLARDLGDAVEREDVHRITERVAQSLVHHHPEDTGATTTERARPRVRTAVAELGRGGEHACPCVLGDRAAAAERERRRRGRDAGRPRHGGECRSHGACGVGGVRGEGSRRAGCCCRFVHRPLA